MAESGQSFKAKGNPVVKLSGRISHSQQVGTDRDNFPIIETLIVTPASDPYQHPNRYCVMSRAKLGADGSDISVDAEVQCRPWKDREGRWHYPHYLWAV